MKLKTCPFCGGDSKIQKISYMDGYCHYYDWTISCNSCPATMQIAADNYYEREYFTEEEAIGFWNRRKQ
jgi:Lar family restriction alleviation protein